MVLDIGQAVRPTPQLIRKVIASSVWSGFKGISHGPSTDTRMIGCSPSQAHIFITISTMLASNAPN
jgi:hypothetical protein